MWTNPSPKSRQGSDPPPIQAMPEFWEHLDLPPLPKGRIKKIVSYRSNCPRDDPAFSQAVFFTCYVFGICDFSNVMMLPGPERQDPGLEVDSDTDTEDEDDSEDEDEEGVMSGTAAGRLACEYESSIRDVLGLALENPGNTAEDFEELREELWLLRQAAQLNMEAAEGIIQFDFDYDAFKTDFDQK